MKSVLIVLAAGSGTRLGGKEPKQFRLLRGCSLVERAVSICPDLFDAIAVVLPGGSRLSLADLIKNAPIREKCFHVAGGTTRQESVYAALQALKGHPPLHVVIHDAARPLASPALFVKVLEALNHQPAACAACPVTDTLRRFQSNASITVPREDLYYVQTPQAFSYPLLLAAHERARQQRQDFTDDAALLEAEGLGVARVKGEQHNIKITYDSDWKRAEAFLTGSTMNVTTAGYDVHAFGPGDHIMCCGVKIAHTHGVCAHSDGDVALHALCDALFGALGEGDIGVHFPPSDEKWKNAPSSLFVREALAKLRQRGGQLLHVDISLIAEAPHIKPYRELMRQTLMDLLNLPAPAIGLKATTSEGLGFTGRREGLAAHVLATVELPRS